MPPQIDPPETRLSSSSGTLCIRFSSSIRSTLRVRFREIEPRTQCAARAGLTRRGPACKARDMSTAGENPAVALTRLLNGYQVSQAVHVAAVLGIPDLLAIGARTADELAPAGGADTGPLRGVGGGLGAVGLLGEAREST